MDVVDIWFLCSNLLLYLGIIGTKEYRKPEWVTHMEELQAALKGNRKHSKHVSESDTMSADSLDKGRFTPTTPDLVICSYQQTKSPEHHKVRSNSLREEYVHSDQDAAMLEYLNSRRHSHSSTREFKHMFDKPTSLEIGLEEYCLESYYPESRQDDVEIVYIEDEDHRKESFSVLSPIEENSERGDSAENASICSSNSEKKKTKLPKLISFSHEHLPSYTPEETKDEFHTLPRAKTVKTNKEIWNSFRFPAEPRELDPEAYHQLHTADSQEELQEFLLLESECMTDGKNNGLASAFTHSDEGPRFFYSDDTGEDRGTVSGRV